MANCFAAADILLPSAQISLNTWASIAVDQFTSQPDYWEKAEELTAGKPSTLHIVLPEAYLGTDKEASRLESIRTEMERYQKDVLTRKVHGYIYVERTQMDGTIRQGLVGAVDLEQYSYESGAKLPIRPSEATVVSRIPPRLKVRRGATLETPHVMMLVDDENETLVEPIGDMKKKLRLVYDGDLMLGGGHLKGWAVDDAALIAQIDRAVAQLGNRAAFAARWGTDPNAPTMTLAVGDGNHSLATAKAYWEELKSTLTPEQQQTHPSRWCLAEVCNVHSEAIEIEGIHRVIFGADAIEIAAALDNWLKAAGGTAQSEQVIRLYDRQNSVTMTRTTSTEPLAVGTAEKFIGAYLVEHPECSVDYIHGEETAKKIAADYSGKATAVLLPDFAKSDLFKGVVLGGVLPRKTFSMGHAEEKRYYNECRSLVD